MEVNGQDLRSLANYELSEKDELGNIIALGGDDMSAAVDYVMSGVSEKHPDIVRRDPRKVGKPETQRLLLPNGEYLEAKYFDDSMSTIIEDGRYIIKAPSHLYPGRFMYWMTGVRNTGTMAIAQIAVNHGLYNLDLNKKSFELWVKCKVKDSFTPHQLEVVAFQELNL